MSQAYIGTSPPNWWDDTRPKDQQNKFPTGSLSPLSYYLHRLMGAEEWKIGAIANQTSCRSRGGIPPLLSTARTSTSFEMRERAKLFSSIAMSHCDCDTSNQFMAVADLNVTPAQIVTVMKPSSANTCSSLSCEKCSISVICGSHACNAMWETHLEIKASAGVRIQGPERLKNMPFCLLLR